MMRPPGFMWMTAAVVLLCGAQPARAQWTTPAEFRVLRSNGPSAARLPPGTALNRTARLRLQRGDSVHLLGSGGTRVLRGPGEFRLDRPTFDPPRRPAEVRRIIAAYRDEGPMTNLWILWTADEQQFGPSYSGTVRFCTPYPDRIVINAWSPIVISGAGVRAAPRRLEFETHAMSWGGFELWRRGSGSPIVPHNFQGESGFQASVTIVALPSTPSSIMAAAELLARYDCRQQLEYLSFWVADAVFDSEMEPAEDTPMPDGPDSGWVQNNHFQCLLIDPDTFIGRVHREEEPCTGEPERDLDEHCIFFPGSEQCSSQPRAPRSVEPDSGAPSAPRSPRSSLP